MARFLNAIRHLDVARCLIFSPRDLVSRAFKTFDADNRHDIAQCNAGSKDGFEIRLDEFVTQYVILNICDIYPFLTCNLFFYSATKNRGIFDLQLWKRGRINEKWLVKVA